MIVGSLTWSSCSINTLRTETGTPHEPVRPLILHTSIRFEALPFAALPGHTSQGLGHIPAGVGADLGEHDVAFLHAVSKKHQQRKELGKGGVKLTVNRIITELTSASCSASLKDTCLSSSMSILFPTRRMGTPSPAASWKTTGKSLIGRTTKDTKLSRGQCPNAGLLSPDSTH